MLPSTWGQRPRNHLASVACAEGPTTVLGVLRGATGPLSRLPAVVNRSSHLVLVLAASHAVVSVPLAMLGLFRAWLVFPLVALVAVGLWISDRRDPFGGDPSDGSDPTNDATRSQAILPLVVVLIAVAGASMLSFGYPTQHYATNRDPGVYVATALLLQRDGDLLVDAASPDLTLDGALRTRGSGFYAVRDDGQLYAQFAHLTAATLAAADMAGGTRALTRVNVVIGAAALMMLYFLGRRLLGPWPAVFATATLAWCLPQMYFSRGPYSEPLAQLLLLGGLAILVGRGPRSRTHLALSGLLIGGVVGSRIDAVLLLPGTCVVLAVWWIGRPSERRQIVSFLLGLALTTTIGLLDLRLLTPQYLTDLWSNFRSAMLLTIVVAIATILSTAIALTRPHLVTATADRLVRVRRRLSIAVGGAVVVVGLFGLFVRPIIQTASSKFFALVEYLQARQGLPLDDDRTYAEDTLPWIAWYLGYPAMILAIVGAAVVAATLFRRWSWSWFAVLLILGLPTAVYLIRPSITPDHIWAMRRFVPAALPLVAIFMAAGATAIWHWLKPRLDEVQLRGLLLVLVAVVAVPTLEGSRQYWRFREIQLAEISLAQICEQIDGRPTLIDGDDGVAAQYLQPVSGRCEVDTAAVGTAGPGDVGAAAQRLAAVGQGLALVSPKQDLHMSIPDLEPVGIVVVENHLVQRSVERAPIGFEPFEPLELFVYRSTLLG